MEVRVLRYFLAIVQEKTITGAARRLHISQPTLSRQITELEAALGTPLFKRGAREVTLTAKGRYLVTRARAIVDLVDKTTQNLTADQTIIGGSLDIGAGESRGLQRLMDVAAKLQQDYPAVQSVRRQRPFYSTTIFSFLRKALIIERCHLPNNREFVWSARCMRC